MTLFRNKYRIETTRRRDWDYSAAGSYFVTICTEDKRCYFGRILDDSVKLSSLGKLADAFWREIPTYHPEVGLDEFIVMPNHIHGILVIDGKGFIGKLHKTGERRRPQPLPAVSPKEASLGTIVRSYKSAVTTQAHEQGLKFEWQPRYHERIIWGKNSPKNIREYIQKNPANWKKDTEFTAHSLET